MVDQDTFLGRALIDTERIASADLQRATQHATESKQDLSDALIELELISSRDLALVKADVCETPFVDLAEYEASITNTRVLPRAIAERYLLFPLFVVDGVLTLAMDDPLNLDAIDQVRQITRLEVDQVIADRILLRSLISRSYSLNQSGQVEAVLGELSRSSQPRFADPDQPAVAAVNQLLSDAVEQGASDVHINPDELELRLRYRIDGVLQERQAPPLTMHPAIVQRLKVMANLDLTQTRRPQDGKFRFRHLSQVIEVRMSTVPTVCGENVVMRLLPNEQKIHSFNDLGMSPAIIAQFEEIVKHPYGMVLVTGPTGSGKTTTLYTALSRLNDASRNIMTIEDPVEIRLPYLRQIQVLPDIGLTFATALRSILRQDPDVVLVGEIRDQETAAIALQAALTGHLVLSTLHTNDAAGAVSRLRDYGLPSFVINSAVLGAVAQRLVRRVCSHCAEKISVHDENAGISPALIKRFGLDDDASGFVIGTGCRHCNQTGYRGRLGIYELLAFTRPIQQAVESGSSADHIRALAVENGMRLLWQDGLEKAMLGFTTLEEIGKHTAVLDLDIESDMPEKIAA